MSETETVVPFPEPKPRLHCLACHAEGFAPCACGIEHIVTVAEARRRRKADAHARYAKDESQEEIAKAWNVSQFTISEDLKDFELLETNNSKRPKSAANPRGAGRKKGSAGTRRPPKPPGQRQHQASINSTVPLWGAFEGVAKARGMSRADLLGQMIEREVASQEVAPAALSLTAQEKLAAAERAMRRKLDAEHAARVAALDEEVRQKVLADNTEYVAMLNGMERKARETTRTYQDFMSRQTKIFTKDEFKLVVMCVHADASITDEKRNEATRLLLSKRFALTGDK